MKIAESLEREGFATIDLADENKALLSATKEAVGAWEAFIKLPEDLKLRFSYSGDVAVGSGVGYELKKGTDGMDSKEDFHARAKSRAALLREAKKVGDVTAIEFVSAALNISTRLGPFVAAYTRSLERHSGIARFERDSMKAQLLWTIRFIHYFPNGVPSGIIASQHTDKGCFTPHLWESAPGLERLTFDPDPAARRWVPMPVGHGETVIFPGLRMQLRSENRFKATCHRVVANEHTAKYGRVSAVAFIDSLNTAYYDKGRCGRTQDIPEGKTYDMPFSEFRAMFKEAQPAL